LEGSLPVLDRFAATRFSLACECVQLRVLIEFDRDNLLIFGRAACNRVLSSLRLYPRDVRLRSLNGERRSFALLRPIADATAQDRISDLMLAYTAYEQELSPDS